LMFDQKFKKNSLIIILTSNAEMEYF